MGSNRFTIAGQRFQALLLLMSGLTLQATSAEAAKEITGVKHALIVGVGTSEIGQSAMPEAVEDAKRLEDALARAGYRCTVLRDGLTRLPTVAEVSRAIRDLVEQAGSTDQILVYFTCHGGPGAGRPRVCLRDGNLEISLIKQSLASSRAAVKILVLDICRNEKGFPTESKEYRDLHVLLSCQPDEISLNDKRRGLGVFTSVFLDGLEQCRADWSGDQRIDFGELLDYLAERVPKLAADVKPGHSQHPTFTVVDARRIHPIIAKCDQFPGRETAIAVRGSRGLASSNQLSLPAEYVGRIKLLMRPDEVIGLLGKPTYPTPWGVISDVSLGGTGEGLLVYLGQPNATSMLAIFFRNGLVSAATVFDATCSDAEYNVDKARRGWQTLVSRSTARQEGRKAGVKVLWGTPLETVLAEMGCPSAPGFWVCVMPPRDDSYVCATFANVPYDGNAITLLTRNNIVQWTVHHDEDLDPCSRTSGLVLRLFQLQVMNAIALSDLGS